jgi:ribose transport system permease protein
MAIWRSRLNLSKISGIYVWIALIVIYSFWLPGVFPNVATARNIATGQAVVAIVTVGLLFALAAGVFDLSIGYAVSLVSIMFAIMLKHGMNLGLAIVLSLAIAVLIGIGNAIVVVGFGIDSFIGTLATGSILTALAYLFTNNSEIVGLPGIITTMTSSQPAGIPIVLVYVVVIAAVAWWLLEHTPFGRRLYAIGAGREAARLAGIQTNMHIVWALIITSFVAGVGGIVLTGTVGAASADVGPSYLLPAFAAAFLGATQISPGRVNVLGTIIATYLLATGSTGLQLAGAASWVTSMFNGLALIIAVGLTVFQRRLDVRRVRREARLAAGGSGSDASDSEPSEQRVG